MQALQTRASLTCRPTHWNFFKLPPTVQNQVTYLSVLDVPLLEATNVCPLVQFLGLCCENGTSLSTRWHLPRVLRESREGSIY